LKPNDLGLFDALGNVAEWCQEEYRVAGQGEQAGLPDSPAVIRVMRYPSRAVRGGHYAQRAQHLSSAARVVLSTVRQDSYLGFRPARTLR
jgi:formylglycine-generating enzyme required for sulfatase activity